MLSNASRTQPTTTEGSALISLGELFKLEERRQEEEREQQRRQREESERTRRDRLAGERAQMEAARLQAEQERAVKDRADAEDGARLAGLMLGFIARAKVDAEAAALEKARQAEHTRTMELERLRMANSTQWLRRGIVAVGATGLLAVAAMLGAYFGVVEPGNEQSMGTARAETAAKSDEARDLRQQLDTRRRAELEQTSKLATLERERDTYKTSAEELRAALENAGKKGPRGPAAGPKPREVPAGDPPKCQYEGDPMCPYIQR